MQDSIGAKKSVRLHQIETVRRKKKFSRRTVARRLGVTLQQVRELEDETRNVFASELHLWTKILGVEIEELLVESTSHSSISRLNAALTPVLELAKRIEQNVETDAQRYLTQMLKEQIHEILDDSNSGAPVPQDDLESLS